ncbi:hypothetical protein Sango_1880500 [Sesamum angolense]|uniref:Reverse transcriptase domain-containing protein n=1 Tax=Sesamum angolense TaxID=2727404 RepID=A0AAE2BQH5_9LAMI|nr:hypothetical protein Sango_1880500 [Sesamum angolense]
MKKRIKDIEKDIDMLIKTVIIQNEKAKIQSLRNELHKLCSAEEIKWKQRGKAAWLAEGDRNTAFFHAKASLRRKINHIDRLKDDEDRWCEEKDAIQGIIQRYFHTIFSSANPSYDELEKVISAVPARVTEDMNWELLKEYSAQEVKLALSQMFPFKSPEPDGMPPIFYQRFWNIVGRATLKCVLNMLNNCEIAPLLNFTDIVLIPKCSNPVNVSQFRPISLCNVVYKLVSKTIANRLKLVLDSIISPSQLAFIPGRLIIDNVLVAFEVNHFLKNKRGGKEESVAIKLDMSKAYDRIEWGFLKRILLKMGFQTCIVKMIMSCVSSVCEIKGNIRGVVVARSAPKVSDLLFADDTLILCQASKDALIQVREVLDTYGKTSGQQINLQKSSIVFSRNTPPSNRNELAAVLGVRIDSTYEKYLGLPQKQDTLDCMEKVVRRKEGRWLRIQRSPGFQPRNVGQTGVEDLQKSEPRAYILEARPILEDGIRWRIGDGRSVQVWDDKWIPRPTTFQPITPKNRLCPGLRVADLIDEATRSWKTEQIDNLFWHDDAAVITTIPIGRFSSPDTQNRNKRVMENRHSLPMEVVASARSFLQDFQNCIVRTNPPGRFSAPTWSPPKLGTIKINFDTSVAKELGGAGLGVIARDHEGNCVAWRTNTLLGATDPEHCEALAARLAVDFGIEQGWRNCLIEGDCILVIQKLLMAKEDASAVGPIISDILCLSHFFDSLSYAHVKRTANSAAHYLAKAAFTIQAGETPQPLCLKPLCEYYCTKWITSNQGELGLRTKGLPHFDSCTEMFSASVATGNIAHSSAMPPLDSNDDDELEGSHPTMEHVNSFETDVQEH